MDGVFDWNKAPWRVLTKSFQAHLAHRIETNLARQATLSTLDLRPAARSAQQPTACEPQSALPKPVSSVDSGTTLAHIFPHLPLPNGKPPSSNCCDPHEPHSTRTNSTAKDSSSSTSVVAAPPSNSSKCCTAPPPALLPVDSSSAPVVRPTSQGVLSPASAPSSPPHSSSLGDDSGASRGSSSSNSSGVSETGEAGAGSEGGQSSTQLPCKRVAGAASPPPQGRQQEEQQQQPLRHDSEGIPFPRACTPLPTHTPQQRDCQLRTQAHHACAPNPGGDPPLSSRPPSPPLKPLQPQFPATATTLQPSTPPDVTPSLVATCHTVSISQTSSKTSSPADAATVPAAPPAPVPATPVAAAPTGSTFLRRPATLRLRCLVRDPQTGSQLTTARGHVDDPDLLLRRLQGTIGPGAAVGSGGRRDGGPVAMAAGATSAAGAEGGCEIPGSLLFVEEQVLGWGAFGFVTLVTDAVTERTYALKRLRRGSVSPRLVMQEQAAMRLIMSDPFRRPLPAPAPSPTTTVSVTPPIPLSVSTSAHDLRPAAPASDHAILAPLTPPSTPPQPHSSTGTFIQGGGDHRRGTGGLQQGPQQQPKQELPEPQGSQAPPAGGGIMICCRCGGVTGTGTGDRQHLASTQAAVPGATPAGGAAGAGSSSERCAAAAAVRSGGALTGRPGPCRCRFCIAALARLSATPSSSAAVVAGPTIGAARMAWLAKRHGRSSGNGLAGGGGATAVQQTQTSSQPLTQCQRQNPAAAATAQPNRATPYCQCRSPPSLNGRGVPFIVRQLGTFQDEQYLYLLLEHCPGGDLERLLRCVARKTLVPRRSWLAQVVAGPAVTWRGMPEAAARFYAAGVLLALQELHSRHIIYRDLKPGNVLIDRQGYPRLADFGMAKVLDGPMGRASAACGTLDYMAPEMVKLECEQLLPEGKGVGAAGLVGGGQGAAMRRHGQRGASGGGNQGSYGLAVDWWSYGVLLYVLLTGRKPFCAPEAEQAGEDVAPVLVRIMNPWYDPPLPVYLSPAARDLLRRLMVRQPRWRLGCGGGGAEEVRAHPFFEGFNWEAYFDRKLPPPYPVSDVWLSEDQEAQSIAGFFGSTRVRPQLDSAAGSCAQQLPLPHQQQSALPYRFQPPDQQLAAGEGGPGGVQVEPRRRRRQFTDSDKLLQDF